MKMTDRKQTIEVHKTNKKVIHKTSRPITKHYGSGKKFDKKLNQNVIKAQKTKNAGGDWTNNGINRQTHFLDIA